MSKKMDKMDVKIYGGIVSIALLLITGRTRATSLQINPASMSIGVSGLFLRLLEVINFKPGDVAWFNSSNTAALSLLTGDAIIKTNPVCAGLTGNNLSGNGLKNNVPVYIQTRISKHVVSIPISLMSSVLPAKTVRLVRQWSQGAVHKNFLSTVITQ